VIGELNYIYGVYKRLEVIVGSRKDELITAVKNNDEYRVQYYLALGASPNAVDKDTGTPALMLAIANGNSKIIEYLLSGATGVLETLGLGKSKEDPERFTAKIQIKYADANGITPLMLVIQKNDLKLLERLLGLPDIGKAINAVDKNGKSALYYAAVNNNGDMLRSLVKAGANPNDPNLLKTLIEEGNEQAVLCLFNNVPLTYDSEILEMAFTRNPTLSGVVDFILEHNDVPIEDIDKLTDYHGWDLLSWAIQRDHYDFAQRWISTTELTVTNNKSTIPFGTQAVSPMKQLVQSIQQNQKKLNLKQLDLLTSLMAKPQDSFSADDFALGRQCLTECLVSLFKELKNSRKNENSKEIKTYEVQINKIIKLAKLGKLNLNYKNAKGDPLHVELIRLGPTTKLLEEILNLPGLDINAKGNNGSALLYALKTEQWDLALMLIKNKHANANDIAPDQSAFAYIIHHINNAPIFLEYIEALKDTTDFNELITVGFGPQKETGLMQVIRNLSKLIDINNNRDIAPYIMILIDKTNLNFQDEKGDTVLTQMISQPRNPRNFTYDKIIDKLLAKGATEGLISHPQRDTFLINAAKNGYYDVLFHMLQNSNTVEADITTIVGAFNKEGISVSPDLKKVLIYHKLRVNNKNPDATLTDFKNQLNVKSGKTPTPNELRDYRNKQLNDYDDNEKFVNAIRDDVTNKENGLIQYLFPDRYKNYMDKKNQGPDAVFVKPTQAEAPPMEMHGQSSSSSSSSSSTSSTAAVSVKPTQAVAPPMEMPDQGSSSSSSSLSTSSKTSVIYQEPYAESLDEKTAKLYLYLVNENAKLKEELVPFIPDASTEPSAPSLEDAPETTNPITVLLEENIRLKAQLSMQSESSSASTTAPIVDRFKGTQKEAEKGTEPPPSYDEASSMQIK
jgi:ankyrin repeat protein